MRISPPSPYAPHLWVCAAVVGLLTLATAGPAYADDPTTATVTITGGVLAINVSGASAGNLGTQSTTASEGVISGRLGQVQVIDARSAAAGSGWVASAVSTAFAPPSGPELAGSLVSYAAGPIDKVGTATYEANDPSGLTTVRAVVTATEITGDNTATWTPTISVTIPGGMAAGVYAATITHSVL